VPPPEITSLKQAELLLRVAMRLDVQLLLYKAGCYLCSNASIMVAASGAEFV
jgi:hypothetical protein